MEDGYNIFPVDASLGVAFHAITIPNKSKNNKGAKKIRAANQIVISPQRDPAPARRKKPRRSMMHPYVLAHCNPFLAEVSGIRVPDEHTYPTATVALRATQAVETNSVGLAAVAYRPTIKYYQGVSTYEATYEEIKCPHEKMPKVGVDPSTSWSTATYIDMPQREQLASQFSGYRVVAAGLRITGEGALISAKGHLAVVHCPSDTTSDTKGYSYWPTSEANAQNFPLYEKFPISELSVKPLIVPFRRLDSMSYVFHDLDTNTASKAANSPMGTGWCDVILFVSGADSSTVILSTEIILHLELSHQGSTSLGFDTAISPVSRPTLDAATLLQQGSPAAHPVTDAEMLDGFAWMDRASMFITKSTQLVAQAASAYMGGKRLMNYVTGSLAGPAANPLHIKW